MTRALFPKYTNSSYNPTTNKQTMQSKNEKTKIDISPKKKYKWPIGT